MVFDPFFPEISANADPLVSFPVRFSRWWFQRKRTETIVAPLFRFSPRKTAWGFQRKSVLYGRQEDNFPSNYQLQNTLHGVSKEAKRRRKIRTILKLYNIWHKKVGTKLFSSSLKKRDSSHPRKTPFFPWNLKYFLMTFKQSLKWESKCENDFRSIWRNRS